MRGALLLFGTLDHIAVMGNDDSISGNNGTDLIIETSPTQYRTNGTGNCVSVLDPILINPASCY